MPTLQNLSPKGLVNGTRTGLCEAQDKAADTENQLVLVYWARTNYVSNEDALSGDIVI